ncbi:VOC family protein [Pseudonocardia sp. CA-107938]|uniref:VOC family protein n=1 Tax=Pseudonocardia sp. CA-107938 TaxID=3240021 RepID=UPI003D89D7EA
MITAVSIVTVFVKDIDAAKAFYVDVLGFSEHTDITLGEGYRWCTVRSASQPDLQIQLTVPGPPVPDDMAAAIKRAQDAGNMFGIGVNVDDCRKTYEDLVAKGVEFVQTPQERPYGVEAVARDNSGNWMVLVESKPYSPADFT